MTQPNDLNVFPEMDILPAGLNALGAFVSGICDCVAGLSPLPKKAQQELSTHVREQDPQGVLEFPEGFGE